MEFNLAVDSTSTPPCPISAITSFVGGFKEELENVITAPKFKPDDYAEFITALYLHAMNEDTSKPLDYPTGDFARWIREVRHSLGVVF